MSFPRYPEYKDSGVEWLGPVPGHWDIYALKRVAYLKSGESITAESIEEDGQYPVFGGNGLRGYTDSFTHEGHYALIGRQGALCGNINYAKGQFWASEHAVVATPIRPASVVWLGELMRAMDLNQYSVSAAQPGLSVEIVSNLRIPVPPLSEQSAIAAFLDHETTKLDNLMAEQEKLIALLKEKRQAVISHAMTKGLDPAVPIKNSGVEWLGEIPGHWNYGTLNLISDRVVVGIAEAATHAYSETGVPILRATNIRASKIIGELLFIDPAFAGERSSKLIRAGDLVTVRTGNAGVTALIPPELDGCQCFTMLITTLDSSSSAEFYCYWMNSLAAQRYFSLEGWGTAQINISVPILKGLSVPIPPFSEQLEIVDFLNHETSNLDQLIDQAESAIDLLKERRIALISAAVTGQIDVRGLIKDEQEQAA